MTGIAYERSYPSISLDLSNDVASHMSTHQCEQDQEIIPLFQTTRFSTRNFESGHPVKHTQYPALDIFRDTKRRITAKVGSIMRTIIDAFILPP